MGDETNSDSKEPKTNNGYTVIAVKETEDGSLLERCGEPANFDLHPSGPIVDCGAT
jgi:hypothetical protein